MRKTLLSALVFASFSAVLSAEPLNKDHIQYLGPIAAKSAFKPYETSRQDTLLSSLSNTLSKNEKSVSIFGESLSWKALSKHSALTEAGLQALKFNLSTERFTQGKLVFNGIEKATVYVNGEKQSGSKFEFDLNLVTGQHQILVICENVADWNKVSVEFNGKADTDKVALLTGNINALSAKALYDTPTISNISLSPDAKWLIVQNRWYNDNNSNKAQSDLAIKDANSFKTVFSLPPGASNFAWSNDNQKLAYTAAGKVYQLDRKTLESTLISESLSGAYGFDYFDNQTLIFSWSKSPQASKGLTKHYQGLEDRWSYARNNTQVYLLDTLSGFVKQVTSPKYSFSLADFSRERNSILVTRSIQDYKAPPHMLTELAEISLSDNKETVLGQYRTFNTATYADDGIYVIAGPDFIDGKGKKLPDDMLTNNYDGQLYQLSFDGKNYQALSRDFDPAISSIARLDNDDLIVKVTERDTVQLYLYDESKKRFNKVNTGFDVVEKFSLSKGSKPQLVATGTTASSPQKLVKKANLTTNKLSTLWDSKTAYYNQIEMPKLEEFNFVNKHGDEIHGRVYLPHNLDTTKKYPALVYYYGGTSPVNRGFTGRYPFNFWAQNGYVVYVVQPTGATGFGQKFSAKHVNAWGDYTADDIIQGTQAFLDKYSFVDKSKVGNLGASYGGFMTMLLATRTDMFSASIAHAGISNITSYWGQGWWGYLYSGEASKNSFPWNNPDLYSTHSPVFNADKVKTPLLLIHGDADTNVPPGESHNMYTALKLLGQDVELVEYKGADHQIFARDRRFHWWDTMLAYFDKHLKQEPQWWDHLYSNK
jgi:dipeptidyl aminopeptidase/acylaminoacyl peptidase